MERTQLIQVLTRTVAAGAKKALALCDHQPDAITKSQAYRLYGRSDIDRWLSEGLLHLTKKHFDRAELQRVAACSNRITYLPVAER